MIMSRTTAWFMVILTVLNRALADPVYVRASPTVTLDSATITGVISGSTNQFLGIPFAQSPTGNLRFRLPQPFPPYDASFSATAFGHTCPQHPVLPPNVTSGPAREAVTYFTNSLTNLFGDMCAQSIGEDCLTLNVITPASANPTSKLPVIVMMVGGAFQGGSSRKINGSVIVDKGVSLSVPLIYVGMNYRVNAFGFLASQEVKDAGVGNLGLHDQRMALRWIQKYINAFGGDPAKVTIWGDSAGGVSVGLQMVTNGGNAEGLFRAAIMQSGSPSPVGGDITKGQPYYDALVAETGCSGAEDTLQCLREAPYETLLSAVTMLPGVYSYQSLALTWMPRVDGVFLTADPQYLIQQGSVADVPFISGVNDDEGTLFALPSLNITTDTQFEEYVRTYWLSNASTTTLAELMTYYSSDPAQGSPFDTGYQSVLTPQSKRMSAFLGDLFFQASRRFFLRNQSGKQNVWTYLNKRYKSVPTLGAYHGSDSWSIFGNPNDADIASYLVRFVTNLDPNAGESTDLYWPRYDATTNQTMLELSDGEIRQSLTRDTFRLQAMAFLTNVSLANTLWQEREEETVRVEGAGGVSQYPLFIVADRPGSA